MNIFKDFKSSLLYIFGHQNWFLRTWPILLIPFIPVVGILAIFVLKGWRFEMVRNFAFGRNELPEVDLPLWLKRGLILWSALFVYLLVPWIVCRLLGVSGIFDMIFDIHLLFTEGLGAYLEDYAYDLLTVFTVYGVWGLISAPTFQCGMVRYVLSDNWKDIFRFLPNFYFAIKHSALFIKFYVMWFMFILSIFFVDSILAATFFGAILIPLVTVTFFYVATAYELGELASKIRGIHELPIENTPKDLVMYSREQMKD